jgi:hypothetical protein
MRAGSATGLQARSVDESYPREFGIPGEETIGPGGLACADRTIGALRPFWAQVARRARAALVINLTNLADIVQRAARTEVGLRIVTVCDSPLGLLDSVACRRWWSIEGQGGVQISSVPPSSSRSRSEAEPGRLRQILRCPILGAMREPILVRTSKQQTPETSGHSVTAPSSCASSPESLR